MKKLPSALKVILNIILYIFYVLAASLAFSFIFPLVLKIFGANILNANDPIFGKIQIFIIFLVLIVTVILRKHFYIPCIQKEQTIRKKKKEQIREEDNLGLEIEIEKEIR